MPTDIMLPRYQCHKKVWALKIAAIEFNSLGTAKIAPVDNKYDVLEISDFRVKFKGDEIDLGYYIQYEDGYSSWSPTKAFEEGYNRI